jgi:hypothetical protein
MATIDWPSNIDPRPEVDSYSREPMNSRLETSVDAGLPKVRNRYTAVPTNVTETFILDRTEYLAFMTWYEDTTKYGSLPFNKLDPVKEVQAVYKFRRGSVPTVTALGGLTYMLSLNLEILP